MKRRLFFAPSIRQRLLRTISTLLLSAIIIFGVISYLGVRNAALKVGQERLQNVSDQLSLMLSGNVSTMVSAAQLTASKPAVKAFLLSGGIDSINSINALLAVSPQDSTTAGVALYDSNGKVLFQSMTYGLPSKYLVDSLRAVNQAKSEAGHIGKLLEKEGIAFYPLWAPISNNHQVIGYLLRWRRIINNAKALNQITQLIGTNAQFYLGNKDGSLWTDLTKPIAYSRLHFDANPLNEKVHIHNNLLSITRVIQNSPWVISVEVDKAGFLSTVDYFLYWLMVSGLILLALGIWWTVVVSRNLSKPIVKLSEAAAQLAAGKQAVLIEEGRLDELGKLARSFKAMSVKVQSSRKMLEDKAENYRLLFERNPLPMWIFSKKTLQIINVNDAALSHYGYTKEEFLSLSILDLRPKEDIEKVRQFIASGRQNKGTVWRHKKKEGTIIMVETIAEDIIHQGQQARLILANDITQKLNAEAELIRHRVMQQELITETTLQAQEKEREELGKELHDNINQILASTKLYLELAKGNSDLYDFAINKSYDNVNTAIGAIRQLSKQLLPPSLGNTLNDSLKDLTQELEAITPISFSYISKNFKEELLNENIKLMIYRVVQEQINNILKYAAAKHVEISLETDSENVYLKLLDDGVGFDLNVKSKGIGLRNIDNRVKFNKGKYSLLSSPGKGCQLEIAVPL